MKHTKKLIPAIGMLLLSASMLVTSTFAWFSMNDKVTADGMSVTAVGDQVYLQIVTDASTFDDNQSQNKATAAQTNVQIKPVAVVKEFTTSTITELGTDAGTNHKWVTNNSNDDNISTKAGEYTSVGETPTNYALIQNFYIRLNPASGKTTATLPLILRSVTLTSNDTTQFKNTVSVFVTMGSKGQLFTQNEDGSDWVKTGDTTLSDGVFKNPTGSNAYETVTVYVFFNGEHEDCTSKNLWDVNNSDSIDNSYAVSLEFALANA